jgi:hypothetical protein
MSKKYRSGDLQELLDQVETAAGESEQVSLEQIMDAVGRRSFGPILVIAGLVILAPLLGDIPGVPTMMAIFVVLVAIQVLMGRRHPWLPGWLLGRSVASDKLVKAIGWLRKPAGFIDRLLRPRLQQFTQQAGMYATAVLCIGISAALPPMELVPFSANAAGLALTTLGLALIANDGLLAVVAFLISAGAIGLVLYILL